MSLNNLKPAGNSTHSKKRVGRGQGSGNGKTAGRGNKGQRARTGYKIKRGFEGGQQPLQRRLPKIGFTSKIQKPYTINVDKNSAVAELSEITIDSIRTVHKLSLTISKIKLIGVNAKSLSSKIKDENVIFSGKEK